MKPILRWQDGGQALHYIQHQVETDQVVEAKHAGLGDPHWPTHQAVCLLHGEAEFCGRGDSDLQRIHTDPVAKESRRVIARHHTFAQIDVAEVSQLFEDLGICIRSTDQLQ